MQKLINEHGVTLRKYSDELITAIGKRSGELLPELASKSKDATELYNNIIDFRKTMLTWSSHSEGAYLSARSRGLGL